LSLKAANSHSSVRFICCIISATPGSTSGSKPVSSWRASLSLLDHDNIMGEQIEEKDVTEITDNIDPKTRVPKW
jgi:hypothetical protein